MPTISAFYGILIRMYFGDHPPPHFHVRYGEHIREWAALHEGELQENWRRCEERLPLQPVEPLQ